MNKNKLNKLLSKTASFYERSFSDSPRAKEILGKHGITDTSIYTKHNIGFSDGSLMKALPSAGEVLNELKEAGILISKGKELLKGQIVFPITDIENNIINLCGFQNGEYTYLPNLPRDTYNHSITKTYPEVFRVDSILDVLALEMAGINNTIIGNNEKVKCIRLDFSPAEVLLKSRPGGLEQAIKNLINPDNLSKTEEGFSLKSGLRSYDIIIISNDSRKLKVTIRAEKSGRKYFDTVNLYSAKERRQLSQRLALSFEELPEVIESDINKVIEACEAHEMNPCNLHGSFCASNKMTSADKEKGSDFGKSKNLIEEILKDFEECGLIGEETNKICCYLAMTSRKMEKPLNMMILSSSGAGKSVLQDTALGFCPPEELIKIGNLSAKALFYREETSLVNKVLALEEQTGANSASYAIRNLITAQALVTETVIRDNSTGKLTVQENRVEAGKTAVFVTTTSPQIDPETKSRFIVTGISESRKQTRGILEIQRKQQTISGLEKNIHRRVIINKHRNFQRLLKKLHVVNPFAEQIEFNNDSLVARRTQPMYLQLINAVCFLHQFQREIKIHEVGGKKVEYIEVTQEDIEIADRVSEVIKKSMDDLSIPARDLLSQISEMLDRNLKVFKEENPDTPISREELRFTRREIKLHTQWRKTRLHTHLKELIDHEYVVLDSGRRGMLQYYRLLEENRSDRSEVFGLQAEHLNSLKNNN